MRNIFFVSILVLLTSLSFFSCKSADNKGNSAELQSDDATEIPCPYGAGIDATTGQYQSCQCPSSHPYYNADSGMCSSQEIADVSCLRSNFKGPIDGPGVKSLNLNATISGNKMTKIEGNGTTFLKISSATPTFKFSINNVQSVSVSNTSDFTIYNVRGSGTLVLSNNISYPIKSITLNHEGSNVMISTENRDNYHAQNCSFQPSFVNTLNKIASH
jgi:hypothetical protein